MSNLKTQNLKTNIRYRAFRFSLQVIKFLGHLQKNRTLFIIADQLLRSATSIGVNLTEAKSSSSKKDFIRFYEIALKSANETLYWLLLLKESQLVKDIEVQPLLDETKAIAKMIAKSLLTIKKKL
jgi:four helix bundle protein